MEENLAVLITGAIGIATTVISGWTSWFFARKKYNSEVDGQVIANMKESLSFYKDLSTDTQERLNLVLEQNKEILSQNAQLLEQNIRLEAEVKTLKVEVKLLTDKLAEKEPVKHTEEPIVEFVVKEEKPKTSRKPKKKSV